MIDIWSNVSRINTFEMVHYNTSNNIPYLHTLSFLIHIKKDRSSISYIQFNFLQYNIPNFNTHNSLDCKITSLPTQQTQEI